LGEKERREGEVGLSTRTKKVGEKKRGERLNWTRDAMVVVKCDRFWGGGEALKTEG